MRFMRRVAIIGAAIVGVAAVALVARTLSAAGVFAQTTPGYAGTCATAARLPVRDIAVDPEGGFAILSVAAARQGHSKSGDGLYVLSLSDAAPKPQRLAGTPKDFHPSGIDLYRGRDGALTLMAVNRRSDGSASIDIFALKPAAADGAVSLTETASFSSSLFVHPRDIAAVGTDRFYVSDAASAPTGFFGLLADYLTLPDGRIIYYNGTVPRVVAKNLRGLSGLAASPDVTKLYAGEIVGRAIDRFDIQPLSGSLISQGDYAMPAGVSGIVAGSKGDLWVAGTPKLFALGDYAGDAVRPAPSAIFRVHTVDGVPQSVSRLFADDGKKIGAADAAASVAGRLLIGSALDARLLVCKPA